MLDESTDDGWRLTIGCDIRATLVTYWNRVAAVIASADAGLGSIDLSFSLCTQVAETGGLEHQMPMELKIAMIGKRQLEK